MLIPRSCLPLCLLLPALGLTQGRLDVIPVYEGQAAYAAAAKSVDAYQRKDLARRHVGAPYLDKCSRGVSREERAQLETSYLEPATKLEPLLYGAQELIEQKAAARLETYLRKAARVQSTSLPVIVCIEVFNPDAPVPAAFMRDVVKGVAGQQVREGVIWMSIYPFPRWFEQASFSIAHEYHHVLRTTALEASLLERLVSEGFADAFARRALDGVTPSAHTMTDLDAATELRIWREMKPHLTTNEDKTVNRYLYGSVYGAEDLPPAVGYAFGRYIVDRFLAANPQSTVTEWTTIPATEVLTRGGYDGCRTCVSVRQ